MLLQLFELESHSTAQNIKNILGLISIFLSDNAIQDVGIYIELNQFCGFCPCTIHLCMYTVRTEALVSALCGAVVKPCV
jgi:hypothetical protein